MLEIFEKIHFVHPQFFLLLLLIPLAVWWHRRNRMRLQPAMTLPGTEAFAHSVSWRGQLRSALPLLRLLAFSALVIALARPQLALKQEEVKADGIDIFLAMDLSSSMLAKDFSPNRLEASKKVAIDFVQNRPYDRFGLAVFAGEAYTQCPLTTDHEVVIDFLQGMQCGYLEDGTAIGMGLATAVNRIKDSPVKSKVVILLTDGVNNSGYIQPLTAAEIAREFDVKVYTIGVGTTGEALTPIRKRPDGSFVFGLALVEIDEELLIKIAETTGGQFFRATSEEALQRIYSQINELEKTEIEITTYKRYSEEFHHFVLWAFIFLITDLILRNTFLRSIP